jgi:uncharacterized protein YndB with AHSA1/START domain
MENPKNKSAADVANRSLVLERVFDAPRHLVFEAWTKPEHLVHWCAPEGFTIPESRGDFREGGEWYALMIKPDGEKFPVCGVYLEIIPDELLVMSHGWIEDDGTRPHETVLKVRFTDEGKKTKVRLEQSIFKSVESRDGHQGGWSSCFDRLEQLLRKLQPAK